MDHYLSSSDLATLIGMTSDALRRAIESPETSAASGTAANAQTLFFLEQIEAARAERERAWASRYSGMCK